MTSPPVANPLVYYKRYRMELDLALPLPAVPDLPAGYSWVAWEDDLLEVHAEVKFQCFVDEIDGIVFPNLSNRDGCLRLMREIRHRPGFLPGATWLLASPDGLCGTVQGVSDGRGTGAIQNLGIVAGHRGRGLGTALLLQAVHGFRGAGMARGMLEVTARNECAVRLYRRNGFRSRKTLYKVVEPAALPLQPLASDNEWCV
jgi:ribosomal protein S18 acetylase RimI-like enzyme